MFNSIFRYFEAPEDNDPVFIRLVRNILIFTIVATVISVVVVATTSNTPGLAVTITTLIVITVLEVLALLFAQRGNVLPAKAIVPVALVLAITIIAFNANSIHDISILAYPFIIIVATLLQGRKSLAATLPIVVGGILFLGIADMIGLSRTTLASRTGIDDILIAAVLLSSAAGILNLLIGRLSEAVAKAEENERAQVKANEELKQLQATLEKQVQERTSELVMRGSELEDAVAQVQRRASQFEAMAQVARTITSIRDLQELLPNVANLINEYYGFYHVGVFLLDEAGEYAVLVASNSPGGRRMLERRHRLKVGEQGIVGSVAGSGEPRIALNVGEDAIFFNNPDLPETQSEMALPLRSAGKVIGTLDVQSKETGAFTNEDVQTLRLLADQVSLAIENARLFDESNRSLNDLQMLMRQSTREAWKRLPEQQKFLGYRYDAMGASPLKESLTLKEPGRSETDDVKTETGPFVVPIELRGEVIGNLVVHSPTGNRWTDDEQDIIRAVAERVALSAENARLFEETTHRAERERLVSEITGKIRSHNDPQAMIETALQELRSALGASRVDILPKTNGGKETKV